MTRIYKEMRFSGFQPDVDDAAADEAIPRNADSVAAPPTLG